MNIKEIIKFEKLEIDNLTFTELEATYRYITEDPMDAGEQYMHFLPDNKKYNIPEYDFNDFKTFELYEEKEDNLREKLIEIKNKVSDYIIKKYEKTAVLK